MSKIKSDISKDPTGYVAEFEHREEFFRRQYQYLRTVLDEKIAALDEKIVDLQDEIKERDALAKKTIKWYDGALNEERAKLLKLYELPIVGRLLRRYVGEDS